jgi:hypothetical protein
MLSQNYRCSFHLFKGLKTKGKELGRKIEKDGGRIDPIEQLTCCDFCFGTLGFLMFALFWNL